MIFTDLFESRDLCHVCGQTPCNCTHIAESAGSVGDAIRSLYQQFYDQGDDALEYLNTHAENFARYWDRFEGDLDSMIAELPPKILARLAQELQSVAAQEGLAEEKVRLDPKCWKGKKIGDPKTKMKGGVRVNNCVPAESVAEGASKLLSVQDKQGVITVNLQAPDGTPRSFSNPNPSIIQRWLDKYGLNLPQSITSKFVYEQAVEEDLTRRGFLKGAGAAAATAAAGNAKAVPFVTSFQVPVHYDTDPPLPRKIKPAWKYLKSEQLPEDDKKHIVQLIRLMYLAKMAPEDWRDSQNGRIIGNVLPSYIFKQVYDLLVVINDSFMDLATGKVMIDAKSKLENLAQSNPEQFKKLQEYYFSKWETMVLMGKMLEQKLTSAINESATHKITEQNGEYSDEAGMAHGNLITIAKAARGLLDTIDQHEDLPEWVQEKIAKVEGMLVSAWNYLQSQEAQGIDPELKKCMPTWQKTGSVYHTDWS